MVYSFDELKSLIVPIAQKHNLAAVYLFGSYARGEATESSDIDILVDTTGSSINSLLQLAAVLCDLEEVFSKPVDLITVGSIKQKAMMSSDLRFRESVFNERVSLYVAA